MYHEYYSFKENPFNITADPEFFFYSSKHNEAIKHLIYGIKERKGIIVLTGEIGTGKTTLSRTLLSSLDEHTKTALILNPNFSPVQLLSMILYDFGIEGKFRSKFDMITALNQFLIKESSLGKNVVLIIDEAQHLGIQQLEQIRLLSNLETEKEKLLQIVLIGQPELIDKLKLKQLRQLNQRVAVRYHIMPLDREELKNYIHHRLSIAHTGGDTSGLCFTERAIEMIYENSQGTPRMINILCDRALLAGFVMETRTIDEHIIHRCAQEIGQK